LINTFPLMAENSPDKATGTDTMGRTFRSLQEMWQTELQSGKAHWYNGTIQYWEHVDPTVYGMLGGYEHISELDIRGSREFLVARGFDDKFATKPITRALDCGGGIGRIAKFLLIPLFQTVDILEQNPLFLEKSQEFVDSSRLGELFCSGMQSFNFTQSYDLIWIQWVIGYLTDLDMVAFFKKAAASLRPGGLICVKDNISKIGFYLDKDDNSINRTPQMVEALIKEAGLLLVKSEVQQGFPAEIFPVMFFAISNNVVLL